MTLWYASTNCCSSISRTTSPKKSRTRSATAHAEHSRPRCSGMRHILMKSQSSMRYPKMPPTRLTYEESCRRLQKQGWLSEDEFPRLPAAMPSFDDEILGLRFFRTFVGDDSFDNLTIPRTY